MRQKENKPDRCQWCGTEAANLTKDHIFPRFMGGTRDLFLWSCRACQEAIGKFETHVSRYSPASIFRAFVGPGPRRPSRPTSGLARPAFAFRTDTPGLPQASFRAGKGSLDLPAMEVNFKTRLVQTRGSREETDLLIEKLREGEFVPHLLDDQEKKLVGDQDFVPKAYLTPDGELHVVALTIEDTLRCMALLITTAEDGAFEDKSKWSSSQVVQPSYRVKCEWNPIADRRVAAKIALGICLREGVDNALDGAQLSRLRRFLFGELDDLDEKLCRKLSDYGDEADHTDTQFVVLDQHNGRGRAAVRVYGARFEIDLGLIKDGFALERPIAARAETRGPSSKMLGGAGLKSAVAWVSSARWRG